MAELKKSKKANLDDKRWKGFLLGLTVACSIFFVAMEYTTRPPRADDDMEVDEDFLEALELKLKKDRDDMISVSSPKPPPPAVTEKVREAEMKSVVAEKIAPDPGDMEASAGDAVKKEDAEKDVVPAVPLLKNDDPLSFRIVQQIPEFPGGMAAFTQWLTHNLKYPPVAQQQRIEGKVIVSFIINKDGSASELKIEQSANNPYLDQEVLRVMARMPKWKPGIENDKPCRTMMAVPIIFAI